MTWLRRKDCNHPKFAMNFYLERGPQETTVEERWFFLPSDVIFVGDFHNKLFSIQLQLRCLRRDSCTLQIIGCHIPFTTLEREENFLGGWEALSQSTRFAGIHL